MKISWLQYAILRIASLLAPADQRAEWIKEWRSELWYVPRRGATLFCLGAFQDALWMRRNNLNPVRRPAIRLETPLQCLTFLAALAAGAILCTACLPQARQMMAPSPVANRASALAGIGGILIFYLPLLAVPILIGNFPANHSSMAWAGRLRGWIFLAMKITLVLATMQCGLVVMIRNPLLQLFVPSCILTFRWVFTDQRRRCPVCLRLLTSPVRIGTPSRTFLEWYGAESTCPRGHGLLHASESSASHSRKSEWLCLDDSWNGLFPENDRHL